MLMCLSGAKPDSDTASHFKRLLNLSEFRNEDIFRAQKKSLNHLYTLLKDNLVLNEFNVMDLNKEENIKKEFIDNVTRKFQNNFTQKENILKLMHSKEKDSQGILSFLNTIYFKAAWLKTFRIKKTKQAMFSTENGMEHPIEMMQITRNLSVCEHLQGLNASVCQLPYMGEKFVMSIILPTKGADLSMVEQKLDFKLLKKAFEKKFEQKVKLQLPKFQFESQVEVCLVLNLRKGTGNLKIFNFNLFFFRIKLSADLIELMKGSAPFESDQAEFTQISNDKLSLSSIFHRTVIEIGEKGTDADGLKSEGETFEPFSFDVEFICNRPFLFVIHDKLFEHVLFVGKFVTPLLVNKGFNQLEN
jgi:serine protease inhibitor